MMKEEKFLFFRIFAAIMLIFFINTGLFIYKYNVPVPSLTGFSIKSNVVGIYTSMPMISKLFLGVQWGLLVLVLLYTAFKDRGVSKRKKEIKGLNITKIKKGSETDLDTLYKVLQTKKQLSIITIQKTFNIKEKLAMEWAKILESGDLAYIDYPRFGGPAIKIKGYKSPKEIEKSKKEDEKKAKKENEKAKPSEKKPSKQKIDRKSKKQLKKFNKETKKIEKSFNKKIKSNKKPKKNKEHKTKTSKKKTKTIKKKK